MKNQNIELTVTTAPSLSTNSILLQLGANGDVERPSTSADASRELGCIEMVGDTMKATKKAFDPVSTCFGSVLGVICCVATICANAEEDRHRPATRYDVVNAKQIRRNEAAEAGCAFQCGYVLGDIAIDFASSVLGALIGVPRASYLSCTSNNDSNNTVLGYSRKDIDEVDLYDSCAPCCCF